MTQNEANGSGTGQQKTHPYVIRNVCEADMNMVNTLIAATNTPSSQ
jgi:hypothetical protein